MDIVCGNSLLSTTNNLTGVMNNNYFNYGFFTSTLYKDPSSDYISYLINNKNTKYVEIFEGSETNEKGKGTIEVKNWWNTNKSYPYKGNPILLRINMFNFQSDQGNLYKNKTYRPVIWN